jgi:uncharacterized protein
MAADPASTGLLGHLEGFVAALRRHGVPASVSEGLDAVRAVGTVQLTDREGLRAALAATLVKRAAHRPAFDTLFDLWWPPRGTAVVADPPPAGGPAAGGPTAGELRERLAELLASGDDAGLRRLAAEAVEALGQVDTPVGRQSWFSYRVLRVLSPDTLVARLLDGLLAAAGQERGGLAEQVARQLIRDRIGRFQSLVDAEVRRRVAQERGPEVVARTAVAPTIDEVDFLRAQRDQLAAMRRVVQPLARRLASRLAARRHQGHAGRLDFRRTVRASLGTGGVPLVTHHRPRAPHKPELVVLCDVSGSVAGFAHFTLMLTAALREQFTAVRAFAFIDTCDEVTHLFAPGRDLVEAAHRIGREARVVWFDGHSDYGHALEVFADRWPDAVGPRTSLLVLGDARTNYRDPGLVTLRRLVGAARHAYWLNPETRRQWGSGDSAATGYAEVIEMVECRTIAQLGDFVMRLV